jgi:peptide chain release factor subunit 1
LVAAEKSTAANIKCRANRHAVADALTAVDGALRRMKAIPATGLAIFSGPDVLECIEPPLPLRRSFYRCDAVFHLADLQAVAQAGGHPTGVIVMDGKGCIVGTSDGTARSVLRKMTVDLPQKHGRGGQSAPRFGRLAEEARDHYATKACELVAAALLTPAGTPAVQALVVVGSGDTKLRLVAALPACLRTLVRAVEDTAYGGMIAFSRGCELAEEAMSGSLLAREREAVADLEREISLDRGRYALGLPQVRAALAAGAAVRVLVAADSPDLDGLLAAIAAQGAAAVVVSDATPEGTRFAKGLTGYAAFLRWAFDCSAVEELAAATAPAPAAAGAGAGSGETAPRSDVDIADFVDFM